MGFPVTECELVGDREVPYYFYVYKDTMRLFVMVGTV